MAAPLLSNNQKAACLAKSTENSKKLKNKNVLCGDTKSWPKPSKNVEESIVLHLTDLFRKLPNIFKPVKNAKKEDEEAKRKIRAQLDLGTNSVCRSLEKDRLACVLVSGTVKPPAPIDHIVSIATERGCPILCLDSLVPSLTKATKSKSVPVCIGFKKLGVNTGSDFVDTITLVKENSSVTKKPFTLKSTNKLRKEVKITYLPDSLKPPCLDPATDSAVCQELRRVFASAAIKEHEDVLLTHKDRKRNKNKKKKVKQYYRKWLRNQFESGKRTVSEFVALGKMRVVLVIKELIPVLMTEHPANSLLCLAQDMDCPIIVVSSLAMMKNADTAKAMAVFGIKKESALPKDSKYSFSTVIETCVNFLRVAPQPMQDMDVGGDGDITSTVKQERDDDDNEMSTVPPHKEDYSFLYISKTESSVFRDKKIRLKEEEESKSNDMAFNSYFISLGGSTEDTNNTTTSLLGKRKSAKPMLEARLKPKKMNTTTSSMDVDEPMMSETQTESSPGFISLGSSSGLADDNDYDNSSSGGFSISRGGDKKADRQANKDDNAEQKTGVSGGSVFSGTGSGSTGVVVMGLVDDKDSVMDKESKHIVNVFDATEKKSKGEDAKRHGQEGFVSFGYTEANIQTMVVDSSKKKKKSKKGGKS